MTDPAPVPPKKPAGPLRFILLGCGILAGLVVLGLGSCAGIMYFIYRGTDPVALVGADYLLRSPELKAKLGEGLNIKRNALGWNVNIRNDSGNAQITYAVQAPAHAGSHSATVWLVKSAGKWSPIGARLVPGDGSSDTIEIGKPPSEHRIKWDD